MKNKDTKIIYIEIDEELISLIDRIKQSKETNLIIVIPKRASILQSIVNLKLLKSQAEKIGKEISLVTTDKTGRNLASQVGLTVYQSLETEKKYDISHHEDDENPVPPAPNNDFSDKISILDTLDKREGKESKAFWSKKNEEKKDTNPEMIKEGPVSYTVASPNKKILVTLFGISTFLLLIIGYYVLPNATIKVQPKIEKISYTTNLTLLDSDRYKSLIEEGKDLKLIGSYSMNITELGHTKEFQSTGERFTGSSPTGTLRIINTVNQHWTFVKGTRFQTEEGIVFRAQERVEIPGKQVADVAVEADEKDVHGNFVGENGNIKKGINLIVPGLREDSQKKIYAEVAEDITDGVTSIVKVLTKEDVLAAKANILDDLFMISETKLRERIEEENENSGLNLRLFTSNDIESITKEIIGVYTPDDLIGKDVSTFQVSAKIKVNGIAYSQNQIIEVMKEGLSMKVLEDRVLTDMKADDIEFHVVTKSDAEKKMKVETTIFGITEYKVNSRLGDKIRGKVLDQSIEDSQITIKDMPEIGEVRIETWPFWVNRIPSVRSNIKVERLE